jgi:hypothetical protein
VNIIKTHLGGKIRYICLNRETSLGRPFNEYIATKGIKAERTALDTAAQNSGSERSRRVIVTKARAMRINAQLPLNMWPEAVKAAAYI